MRTLLAVALVCGSMIAVDPSVASAESAPKTHLNSVWSYVDAFRQDFIFGPSDAESVRVTIEIDGTTRQLDSAGILIMPWKDDRYFGSILLAQREALEALSSVRSLRPVPLAWDPYGTTKSWSEMTDRERLLRQYPYATILGPPEAESVDVAIQSCEASHILDSLQIAYEIKKHCVRLARVSLQQYHLLYSQMQTQIAPLHSPTTPLEVDPRVLVDRSQIFGPPEAESVHVSICTDGHTAQLDSAGVVLAPLPPLDSCYSATIRLDQYWAIWRLPSVLSINFPKFKSNR